MKTADETTKDFLNEQLKRTDLSEEYRSAIQTVLISLNNDKQNSEQIWKNFMKDYM